MLECTPSEYSCSSMAFNFQSHDEINREISNVRHTIHATILVAVSKLSIDEITQFIR